MSIIPVTLWDMLLLSESFFLKCYLHFKKKKKKLVVYSAHREHITFTSMHSSLSYGLHNTGRLSSITLSSIHMNWATYNAIDKILKWQHIYVFLM